MPLPILAGEHHLDPADMERLFHRTGLYLSQEVGETRDLDCGTAVTNSAHPGIGEANHMWDASLAAGQSPSDAVAEAEAHFAGAGSVCGFWVINPAEPIERTQPLSEYLLSRGWRPRSTTIFHLSKAPLHTIPMDGLTIIPSRASFRHAQNLAVSAAREIDPARADALAFVTMLRLDDPHYDAMLALRNGTAVAQIGVLSVGDMGRLDGLFVHPEHRGHGLAKVMLARAMEVCARSVFRHVFTEIDPAQATANHLARAWGFEPIGSMLRLLRAG
jgi:GNAT superfamily N-acetyltransferase